MSSPHNRLKKSISLPLPLSSELSNETHINLIVFSSRTLTNIKQIGEGTYGGIYSSEFSSGDEKPHHTYAVKENYIDKTSDFRSSVREADLLYKFHNHPFIVSIKGISFENPFTNKNRVNQSRMYKPDNLYFMFEEAAYDGHTLIHGGRADIPYKKLFIIQFLLGIEYMHAKNIIHRDLKPSNLLWYREGSDRVLKICDFGLAKPFCDQEPSTPRVQTPWYRAPEISFKCSNYDAKSDMWSVGCILFELITGQEFMANVDAKETDLNLLIKMFQTVPKLPSRSTLAKLDGHQILKKRVDELYKMKRPHLDKVLNLSEDNIKDFNSFPENGVATYSMFIDLLSHIMVIDPDERYSATQALNHGFFDSFRDYINQIKAEYPPEPDPFPLVNIHNCEERQWAISIVNRIFNNQFGEDNKHKRCIWYRHRILFLALDIYDRYLHYIHTKGPSNIIYEINKPKKSVSSPSPNKIKISTGKFHNKQISELNFMVCVYLAYKYFNVMTTTLSFNNFVTENFQTETARNIAEQFELQLLRCVLDLKIYRPSIFEMADQYNTKLSIDQVRDMLAFYGSLKDQSNVSVKELYNKFMNKNLDDDHVKLDLNSKPIQIRAMSPTTPTNLKTPISPKDPKDMTNNKDIFCPKTPHPRLGSPRANYSISPITPTSPIRHISPITPISHVSHINHVIPITTRLNRTNSSESTSSSGLIMSTSTSSSSSGEGIGEGIGEEIKEEIIENNDSNKTGSEEHNRRDSIKVTIGHIGTQTSRVSTSKRATIFKSFNPVTDQDGNKVVVFGRVNKNKNGKDNIKGHSN